MKQKLWTYNPLTGTFYKDGELVQLTPNTRGYCYVCINGTSTTAHRAAFFLMEGVWPEEDVDHIDGNRSNNKWDNLRKATRSQNLCNMKSRHALPKNVYLHPSGKYRVKMKINGSTKHFGYYDSLELAELVASEVQDRYHGSFAPTVQRR